MQRATPSHTASRRSCLHNPTTTRYRAHCVAAASLQLTSRTRAVASARPATTARRQTKRSRLGSRSQNQRHCLLWQRARAPQTLDHVRSHCARRRVLEDERRRQRKAHKRSKPRRQLRRRERVDARLHQWRLRVELPRVARAQLADQPQHANLSIRLGQPRASRASLSNSQAAALHVNQQRRQLAKPRLRRVRQVSQQLAHVRAVRRLHAQADAVSCRQLCAEARSVLLKRDARHAHHRHLTPAELSESLRAHARTAHHRPLQAARNTAGRALRQRATVQPSVCTRVAALADVCQARANRREEHARFKRRSHARAMQVTRAASLARKHPPQPRRLQVCQQPCVGHASGMQQPTHRL